MKRTFTIASIVLAVILAWVVFMGYTNSRMTVFDVQVDGSVDQVLFYRAADAQKPVAAIITNGQSTEASVNLQNTARSSFLLQQPPTQYYFVTKGGDQSYTSPTICCETGFLNKNETLTIRGVNNWEKAEK